MRKPLPLLASLLLVLLSASCTTYYGPPPPPPPPPRVVYQAPPPPAPVYQAPPAAPPVADNTAVGTFYGSLSPYGQWVFTASYGWCWQPHGIAVGWRPYTDGYWALTDYGWTFVSTVPWSWACYHYGRWFYDSRAGWLWYPDVEWAPAWVVWRTGGDYIGWCPIPPGVAVADFGFASRGFSVDVAFPSFAFSFVRFEDFDRDDVHRFIFAPSRNVTIINQTNIFVGIGHEGGHMVNRFHDERGFEERIERSSRRPIPRYRVSDRREPGPAEVSRNEVRMFRPDLRRPEGRQEVERYSYERRGNAPRDMTTRQREESRSLEQGLSARRSEIQQRQRSEMRRTPAGVNRQQLEARHQSEVRGYESQAARERSQLNEMHSRESRAYGAASRESPRPARGSQQRGAGRGRYEDRKTDLPLDDDAGANPNDR